MTHEKLEGFGGEAFRGGGWRLIWRILRRHRFMSISILVLTLGVYASSLSVPVVTQQIIDGITTGKSSGWIAVLGGVAVVMSVLDVVLADLRGYQVIALGQRVERHISLEIMARVLGARMDLVSRDTGDVLNKTEQTDRIKMFLVEIIPFSVFNIGAAILASLLVFVYSVYCGLAVMAVVAGGFLVSRAVLDYYYENISAWFKARSAKQGALAETVGGLETIKALAVEPGRFLHWARKTADFAEAGANLRNGNRRFFRVTRLSDHVLTLAVVAIGGYQMMHGTLTTGDLFAVLMLSGKISATLLGSADIVRQWQEVNVSINELGRLLDRPVEKANVTPPVRSPLSGGIEFRNVTYRYKDAAVPAISGLDLRLPETGMCALIGRNGSGKSTMLRLIQGFLREYEGELLAGGAEVRSYHPRWLRSHMAVVNQDTILFAGTVRQNVTCWMAGVTDDDICKALHLAGAWEFVDALPDKLDARLTENGGNLSGGQRQRLSVARAVLRDPRIVLLDEPTAFLDAEAAVGLETRLAAWGQGRLMVLVSHHLAATRMADTIILLDEGRVAAQGGHAELLETSAVYQSMWRNYLRESGAEAPGVMDGVVVGTVAG